jgi:hypothetical protein
MKRETAFIFLSILTAGAVSAQENVAARNLSAQPENNSQQSRPAASQNPSRKDAKISVGPNFASPSQTPELENPRASEVEASTSSALQKQKQIVDAEVLNQTKLVVHPAGLLSGTPSQPMASGTGPLLGGSTASRATSSTQTPPKTAGGATAARDTSPASTNKGGSMNTAGSGTMNPPTAGSTNSRFGAMLPNTASNAALTCSTNPTMRILTVAGTPGPAIFTPITAYDLYTISGCSFGNAGPDAKAYLYKGGGFREAFQILEWHDNWVKLSLDPKISGVLDQEDVTLVIQRADGTQASKGGFKFHSVRGTTPLQLIPSRWAHLVTWSHDSKSFSPEYSSPAIVDGKTAGPSAYVSRFVDGEKFDPNAQPLDQQYDSYDFSGLAPGWTAKSAQLKTFDITCTDKTQPYITTYYERFGNWRTQWDGNALRVYLADATCSSFDAAMPLANKQNHTGSYYQLLVVAYGPRCTDPLSGKPDQQCIQRVQQGLQ